MSISFPRRRMLRGLGVSMALPWMESLPVWGDERPGNRPSSEAPVRLAVLFAGNGFHSKEWWAKGEGSGMELGEMRHVPAEVQKKVHAVFQEVVAGEAPVQALLFDLRA